MQIAIAIFGIPRGSELTQPSIFKNIIEPVNAIGSVKLFGHLFDKKEIINNRSNESGMLSKLDYQRFQEFEPHLEEPEKCLHIWKFDEICKYGDIYEDNYLSLRNLLHQLHSLNYVTKNIEIFKPDVIVFIRPDLIYHQPIQIRQIINVAKNSNRIILPEWQWWNGYNDRFAICGASAYQTYGKRVQLALKYCTINNRPLHAERLLRHAISINNCSVRVTKQQASRVRINNVIKEENFKAKEKLGHDSRRLLLELRTLQILSMFNI